MADFSAAQNTNSRYRTQLLSLFIIFFISVFSLVFATPALATDGQDDQTEQITQVPVDDPDVAPDDIAPVITPISPVENQQLSGTAELRMTVAEDNPQQYSIQILNPDGSNLLTADGQPMGVTIDLPTSPDLVFSWDTTSVADGSYRIVFGALDTSHNPQTVEIPVTVANTVGGGGTTDPGYPPVTPELHPIPISEAIEAPLQRALSGGTARAQSPTETSILSNPESASKDVLAERVENTAKASQQAETAPPNSCGRFFGVCWYISVPITGVVSAVTYYAIYRLQRRVPRAIAPEALPDIRPS